MRAFWLRLNIHLCDLCDSYEFISRNYLLNILTILTLNHYEHNEIQERKQWEKGKEWREDDLVEWCWLLSFAFRFCHAHSRGVPVHKNLSEACQLKRSVVFHIHHKLNDNGNHNNNNNKTTEKK